MRWNLGDWLASLPGLARGALILATMATCAVFHMSQLLAAQQAADENIVVRNADVVYIPDSRMSRITMLGYDQAAADVLWLRTLGYFGRHFASGRRYRWLEFLLDQILDLDPRFKKAYQWAGANVLYGRKFENKYVRISNRFYEKCVERFPDDYECPYRLGLNYYVELRSDDPEERRRFREIGASWLERAANAPDAPPRMKNLVASIWNKLGDCQLAIQYRVDLLVQTADPEERAAIAQHIQAMQQECAEAAETAAAATRFRDRWQATFPYVPDHLYILLGEPATRAIGDVSWRTLIPDINVETSP